MNGSEWLAMSKGFDSVPAREGKLRPTSGIPDMRFINKKIPIVHIAQALDISPSPDGKLHCWHPERHYNGDRTASVGVRKPNNTVKCFGCDSKPLGPVDLVMDVMQMNLADAAKWIASRFEVPEIPKKARLVQPKRLIHQAGFEGELGLLVRSGLWSELSAPARCLAPVLLEFSPREHGKLAGSFELSYSALERYSGLRSPNAISKAIRELEDAGWLSVVKEKGERPLRRVSKYLVTPYSDSLSELANENTRRMREEIAVERKLRTDARLARKQKF